jgi:hypothetical protein
MLGSSVVTEAVRLEPGFAIGPYIVERRLGSPVGSAACVARSRHGGRVVIKVLSGPAASPERGRLLRDARALAAVEHRNVARVDGMGEHDGFAWVAVEYVQGTDLARLMTERGALPADAALDYALKAAEGLGAALGAGVVHGAVQPSTLLLAPDGRVAIVDFGVLGRASTAYLSPERIEQGTVDARGDVWSLGCVLFEMLTGEPPFGRGGALTRSAIVRDEPDFPPVMGGTVTSVVSACLGKSPFARIGSAQELVALLREALGSPGLSHASSASRISTAPSRPLSMPPSLANGSRAPASRGRVKGTALRAGLAWFMDAYGASAAAHVMDSASAELMATLRVGDPALGVMPSGWYETQLVGELLIAMERAAAPADPEAFVARLAEAIARDNVRGVYRSLFRLVASPSLLEANAQRIWRTYVDEGTLAVRVLSRNSFDARVRGWSHHHTAVCRMLRHMLEQLLRTVGYRDLVVERTGCVIDGAAHCSFAGSWSV